jgi:hypothetical protein
MKELWKMIFDSTMLTNIFRACIALTSIIIVAIFHQSFKYYG